MSKFWIKGRRPLAILPGLMAGILTGLLITVPYSRQASAPSNSNPILKPSEMDGLSPAELEALALKALSTLREKRGLTANHGLGAGKGSEQQSTNSWQQVHLGMKNIRRLLPLAKQLTLESLREAQTGNPSGASGLLREQRLINAVHQVVLDPSLGDTAEVWEEHLSEIRVGSVYAPDLISDDEAIFLLGHELTHVAVRSGRLDQFIENVTETARLSTNVETAEDQREDLACDFTGAEVLKRFIALYPTEETEAERFSRVIGYETSAERLAHVWEDYCAGGSGDEDHLSQDQTIRALLGLDPELKSLLLDDFISSPLCH